MTQCFPTSIGKRSSSPSPSLQKYLQEEPAVPCSKSHSVLASRLLPLVSREELASLLVRGRRKLRPRAEENSPPARSRRENAQATSWAASSQTRSSEYWGSQRCHTFLDVRNFSPSERLVTTPSGSLTSTRTAASPPATRCGRSHRNWRHPIFGGLASRILARNWRGRAGTCP